MLTLRVFVGISQIDEAKASYALTFQNADDAKSITIAPVVITSDSVDFVILTALKTAVDIITSSKEPSEKMLVNMYSGSDLISFTWEEEYRKEGCIYSDTAKHREIWNYLINKSKDNNLDLHIFGETAMLNGLRKMGYQL